MIYYESKILNIFDVVLQIIKMLCVVVAIFTICWGPLQAYNIIDMYLPEVNM